MSAIQRTCSFNGVSLQGISPYITVYAIDYSANPKTLDMYPLARRNARKVSSAFYQTRKIYVSVYITAPSRAAADIAVDNLLANIQTAEAPLIIEQSGTTRQYTATYSKLDKNNTGVGKANVAPPMGGFDDFTIEFECSDSYGYDVGPTLICNLSNQTTSYTPIAYTQGGGAEWQTPVVQVQIQSLTGGSGASITIGNGNNGMALTVNRNWSQYDLLVIDSQHKTVQVNGVDVAFSGSFPEFNTGSQLLTYNDTFTARNVKIYANVYNRWN